MREIFFILFLGAFGLSALSFFVDHTILSCRLVGTAYMLFLQPPESKILATKKGYRSYPWRSVNILSINVKFGHLLPGLRYFIETAIRLQYLRNVDPIGHLVVFKNTSHNAG